MVGGRDAYLTDVGRAVRALMPATVGGWAEVHARLTTFFQYKSIPKHAGLIAYGALGGASAGQYIATKDLWQAADHGP